MSTIQNSHMIAVALGAAIGVLGAASLFIYEKIMENNEKKQMMDKVESVNKRIAEIQTALDNIKTQQEQQRLRKNKNLRKRITSTNSFHSVAETNTEVDAMSVTETDIDDEFYDCSDDELTSKLDERSAAVELDLPHQLVTLDNKIEDEEFYEEVLCELRSLANWYDNDVEVIWRLARACSKNASNLTDTKRQDIIIQEGLDYCERLIDKEHADLHKWYAILLGLRTEYLPIKQKLLLGKCFEKHVKLALKLRPDDATSNYLLGRFQYSISELSWFERKMCETLFGEVPNGTYNEAIEHLEKANQYTTEPDIEIKYFLAKCYIQTKLYNKCVNLLNEITELLPNNKKQMHMQLEAKNLLKTYSTYRY